MVGGAAWDVDSRRLLAAIDESVTLDPGWYSQAAISGDGTRLAVAGDGLTVIDLRTRRRTQLASSSYADPAFGAGGEQVYATLGHGSLWAEESLEIFLDVEAKRQRNYHMTINPAGAFYATDPMGFSNRCGTGLTCVPEGDSGNATCVAH